MSELGTPESLVLPPNPETTVKVEKSRVPHIGKFVDISQPMPTQIFQKNYELNEGETPPQANIPVLSDITITKPYESNRPLHVAIINKAGTPIDVEHGDIQLFALVYDTDPDTHVRYVHAIKHITSDAQTIRDRYRGGISITQNSKGKLFIRPIDEDSFVTIEKAPDTRRTKVKNITRRMGFRKEGLKKRIAKGLLATTLFGLHGGPVDAAQDPFNDAKQTVLSLGIQQNRELGYTDDEPSDSWKNVARTMGDLDNHHYDAIIKRANEYREKHKDQFQTKESLNAAKEKLSKTSNTQEALAALNEFLQFYGKSAGLDKEEDLEQFSRDEVTVQPYTEADFDELKKFGIDIVDVVGGLPKSLIERMEFNEFRFIHNLKGAAAHYDKDYSGDNRNVIRLAMWRQPGSDITDPKRHILFHEMSHALFHPQSFTDTGEGVSTMVKYSFDSLFGSPEYPSLYGVFGGVEENRAEKVSQVLEGEASHPDNVRKFNSEANRERLAFFTQLENGWPGITDVLCANVDLNSEKLM